MIGDRNVLAVIPARGGSKSLPGKNILPVLGRPLLAWSVDAARGSRFIDRLVVSSDDEATMDVARRLGCEVPFRRPGLLASDSASSVDVVLHALDALPGHDVVVLLQPTSPLRTAADIDSAFEMFAGSGAPACVSVSPVEQSPYWMYRLSAGFRLQPLIGLPSGVTRRQDLPDVCALNGAIYIAETAWLRETRTFLTPDTVAYMMPIERSLDIDTAADLEVFRKAVTEDIHA